MLKLNKFQNLQVLMFLVYDCVIWVESSGLWLWTVMVDNTLYIIE